MSNIPYTISDKGIVMMIDGSTYKVTRSDERFPEVLDAVRKGNFDVIPSILDLKGKLVSDSNGGLYLRNGMLFCDQYSVPSLLASRIIEFYKQQLPIENIGLFLENMMQNPSEDAREELYGFIEACDLPITTDGHFLAYKMVRSDFKDLYTGKMDNSVGKILEMPRENCDADRNRTCSSGLHFCSEGYLGHYGTRGSDQVVIVKINPRDVVSIPTDYDNAKGRACRYEVVDAISWDQKITPHATNEYSVDVNVTDEFRWEVRNRSDNDSLVARFKTRQNARDYIWNDYYGADDLYVRDRLDDDPDPSDDDDDYTVTITWGRDEDQADMFEYDEDELTYDEDELDVDTMTDSVVTTSSAVLTESQVRDIHYRLQEGFYTTLTGLADEYGVSDRTIRRIRDGESWVHITRPDKVVD